MRAASSSQFFFQFLAQALTQKNAQKVQEYGPPLEERFAHFTSQFGADLSAQHFIRETQVRTAVSQPFIADAQAL